MRRGDVPLNSFVEGLLGPNMFERVKIQRIEDRKPKMQSFTFSSF